MATKASLPITTPVGRLVAGSVYEGRTTDWKGNPLTIKNGANKGQPRSEWSFGVAIAKNPGETHWSQNPFFAPIWNFAHQQFPGGEAQRRDFAWKIDDGDDTEPNKVNKRNCDREGFPGHWVIWFSSGMAPQIYNADGTQIIQEKDAVKRGYYVQVFGNVTKNDSTESPGIYINHRFVAFAAYGQEIMGGPDVSEAGFGKGTALPAGASAAPLAGGIPATGATPPAPPAPPAAGVPTMTPPAPPAPAAAAPARQLTAKAAGQTYEALIAAGWTDALLIQHGMMLAPAAAVPTPPAPPAPLPVGSVPTPPAPAATAVAPPPSPVTPNPAILGVPGATPPAPPAPPAPVPAARVMLPAANGQTYDAMIAAGWTDALLVQHGMMAA